MNDRVLYRPLRAGVSRGGHLEAVRNGTREAVLAEPAELPQLAYEFFRSVEDAFGGPVVPLEVDAAELRERLALWEREWQAASPCDRNGDPLGSEAEAPPLSPLDRRQFKPRRKAGAPRVDADRERREPAFLPARDARRGPSGGAVRVPWHLRKLVHFPDGAEWWRLQCLGLGRSPAARAAYAAALRQLNTPAEKAGKVDGDKAEPQPREGCTGMHPLN